MSAFRDQGWKELLLRKHRRFAIDVYDAIVALEQERGCPPGSPIRTSTREIAKHARHDRRHIDEQLDLLHRLGLLAEFTPGCGGPSPHTRQRALVRRAIPIPKAHWLLQGTTPAVTTLRSLSSAGSGSSAHAARATGLEAER